MNETQQDRQDRDQAEAHAAMLDIQLEAQRALDASVMRPLTEEERASIAWLARLTTKEIL